MFTREEVDFLLHTLGTMRVRCVDEDAEVMTTIVRGIHNKLMQELEDLVRGTTKTGHHPYQPLPVKSELALSINNLRDTRERKEQCLGLLNRTG